jgi:pseudouridine-5'-phosphate glycosidase
MSAEVSRALQLGQPVVALESTVITHGLPFPENLSLAEDMERTVRNLGVVPATVAVLDGRIHLGLRLDQLQRLANAENLHKISIRDFGPAVGGYWSGGTTVAGTMFAAQQAGIQVFATGGIGGVHHDISTHRRGTFDISADLQALASIPMITVCAGAKAILDLHATLEVLETYNVPVVGFGTDDFPAFYSRQSGLKTSARAGSLEEVAHIALSHWSLGLKSAVLVAVPPPEDVALPPRVVSEAVRQSLKEARERKITGQKVTPFLLSRVNDLTGGASLRANLGLLLNNAQVAAGIARVLSASQRARVA